MLALFQAQFGIEQQAGHAEHAVHRGADFVADVGDELGLEPGSLECADFPGIGVQAGLAEPLAFVVDPVQFDDAPHGQDADGDHARENDDRNGKACVVILLDQALECDPAKKERDDDGRGDQPPGDKSARVTRQDRRHDTLLGTGAEDGEAEKPETDDGMEGHLRLRISRTKNLGLEQVDDQFQQGKEQGRESQEMGHDNAPAATGKEQESGSAEEKSHGSGYTHASVRHGILRVRKEQLVHPEGNGENIFEQAPTSDQKEGGREKLAASAFPARRWREITDKEGCARKNKTDGRIRLHAAVAMKNGLEAVDMKGPTGQDDHSQHDREDGHDVRKPDSRVIRAGAKVKRHRQLAWSGSGSFGHGGRMPGTPPQPLSFHIMGFRDGKQQAGRMPT